MAISLFAASLCFVIQRISAANVEGWEQRDRQVPVVSTTGIDRQHPLLLEQETIEGMGPTEQ